MLVTFYLLVKNLFAEEIFAIRISKYNETKICPT